MNAREWLQERRTPRPFMPSPNRSLEQPLGPGKLRSWPKLLLGSPRPFGYPRDLGAASSGSRVVEGELVLCDLELFAAGGGLVQLPRDLDQFLDEASRTGRLPDPSTAQSTLAYDFSCFVTCPHNRECVATPRVLYIGEERLRGDLLPLHQPRAPREWDQP